MQRRAWFAVALAALTGACGSTVNVGRERTLLLETDKQWSDSANDLDKFLSYYSAEAAVYAPGTPVAKGTATIRDAFNKMRSAPGFSLRWTPANASVSGAGDLGYTTGTYRLTTNDAGGSPVVERGKYVVVWKKAPGGQWKVAEDIFNADAPPPASEPKVAAAPAPAKPTPARAKSKKPTSRRRR